MNYFRKTLLLFLLFLTNTMQPFVSYYLLKKDNNYILILGDMHSLDISETNDYHVERFVECVNSYKFKKPIPFILEHGHQKNNFHINTSEEQFKENKQSGTTIHSLNKYFEKNKKVLDLLFYDCRESQAAILYHLLNSIDELIESAELDFESFKQNITHSSTATLKEYADYICLSCNTIQDWLNSITPNSVHYQEMDRLYKKYKKKTDNALSFFKDIELNINLDAIIIDRITKCQNIEEVKTIRKHIYHMFYTDVCFGDIGFLNQLIQIQTKHPKTLFVAGNTHAINISKSLQRIGYELISQKYDSSKEFINLVRSIFHTFIMR